jgi:hypothetical protein
MEVHSNARRHMYRALAVVVAAGFLAGCENPLTVEDLAGTYVATTLTVTEGGATQDLLAVGASITVTLNSDGSTQGRFFVPGGNENGSDFDADLSGTWSLNDSQISFEHVADTFMRDASFSAGQARLTAQATFGSATLHAVLQRQ